MKLIFSTGKNSGLWKPNADFGECGKRLTVSNIVGVCVLSNSSFNPNISLNDMFPIEAGELLLESPISLKEIFPIEAGDEEALLDCFDTVFFFQVAHSWGFS